MRSRGSGASSQTDRRESERARRSKVSSFTSWGFYILGLPTSSSPGHPSLLLLTLKSPLLSQLSVPLALSTPSWQVWTTTLVWVFLPSGVLKNQVLLPGWRQKGSYSENFLFKAEQETNDSAVHWDHLGLEI